MIKKIVDFVTDSMIFMWAGIMIGAGVAVGLMGTMVLIMH